MVKITWVWLEKGAGSGCVDVEKFIKEVLRADEAVFVATGNVEVATINLKASCGERKLKI